MTYNRVMAAVPTIAVTAPTVGERLTPFGLGVRPLSAPGDMAAS
jgi:hypothetical protein